LLKPPTLGSRGTRSHRKKEIAQGQLVFCLFFIGPLLLGKDIREQTESYNWYNVGRFLLSKKLNPWVVPGKAPPEGATSLVVLDSVDKDRKRVLGNLLKEKWRKRLVLPDQAMVTRMMTILYLRPK